MAVSVACGGSGSPGPTGKKAEESGSTVVMELVQFKPETLSVAAGTTVTWQQGDAGAHTVTSGRAEQSGGGVEERPDGKFDSGEIQTGESFDFRFSEPGVYPYFCSLHPATMSGEVKVT